MPQPPSLIAPPPEVRLANVEELGNGPRDDAFLELHQLRLRLAFPDGSESEPFRYDVVRRRSDDSVAIVATFEENGVRYVYLRSTIRVAIAIRSTEPVADRPVWEIPAGLIDPGETPIESAIRELEEELGFQVTKDALRSLGSWSAPSPALIGEVQHFFVAEVIPAERRTPSEDGSPLERHAGIESVSLEAALGLCREGGFRDAKTELALWRFADEIARGAR